MPKKQPYPYLKREIHRGRLRWRFRRVIEGVEFKRDLPDYPGASKEAEAAYYAALENRPGTPVPGEGRFAQDTFGHLIGRYLGSPKFLGLAAITQSGYRRQLDALRRELGEIRYRDFRRKHVVALIERKASTPGEGNNRLKALQALFTYAVKADLIAASPAAGVEKLRVNTERAGGAEPWTDEQAAMFRAHWPLGSPQRTLMEIMWGTSLRIGDAKSHIIALAALAAIGFAGGAYAKDARSKVTAPTVMSDSEMDKVTAGVSPANPGYGVVTAAEAQGGLGVAVFSAPTAREGVCTTGASNRC